MPDLISKIRLELKNSKDPQKAKILQRFFKTGVGQYAEGDIFLGITVPTSRKIAQKFRDLQFGEIKKLLLSKIHEERLIALLILVDKFQKGTDGVRGDIYKFYLANSQFINNWDLVDLTADKIVGEFLKDKPKSILYRLVRSQNLWERRIAIIATFQFIKNNMFEDTLKISKILLSDKHDLIHKAVGWMLREVGKREQRILVDFLKSNYQQMSRTTLRYSIERFPENIRKAFLAEQI